MMEESFSPIINHRLVLGRTFTSWFLRENLPNDVKVTQGFVSLDKDFDSIRQKLYFLTNKKENDAEYVFQIQYHPSVILSFIEIML